MSEWVDQIVAVYAVDIVKAARDEGRSFTRITDIFKELLKEIPVFKKILEKEGLHEDQGDGVYLISEIIYLPDLLDLARELSIKLEEYNKSEKGKRLPIIVRQGIHVGHCKVRYLEKKIVEAKGSGKVYAIRVMNLDEDGSHILLTNSACATILSQTNSYKTDLHYVGKYLIKGGQVLQVWNYYLIPADKKESSFGDAEEPKKKITPAILKINKKNQALGITLIAVSIVGVLFSGIAFGQFYDDVNISDIEKTMIESNLKNKISEIIGIQNDVISDVEKEVRYLKLNNTGHLELSSNQENIIQHIVDSVPHLPDIVYLILSNPYPHCDPLVYTHPFGTTFDKTIDFSNHERCVGMKDNTFYHSSSYFATGPKQLVTSSNAIVYNDSNDPIAHIVIGINWSSIINEILHDITLDNVRIILVDHKNTVVANCFKGCENYLAQKRADNYDTYPDWLNQRYEDIIIPISEIKLTGENVQIMRDWELHVIYSQLHVLLLYALHLPPFITLIAILGVLIYYYIIPRNWLDDDMTKTVN